MIYFDAMLYADAKEMDENQDKLISSSELGEYNGVGYGRTDYYNIDNEKLYEFFENGNAKDAIMLMMSGWVDEWGHGLWTSAEEMYSISMRNGAGQHLYSMISSKTAYDADIFYVAEGVFYAASASDYYNTVNTISALASEIAPFWN